jgi:hypothetical protein
MFRVKSMKMRRAVIPPEHLDYDTIKNANRRHMRLLSRLQVGEQRGWLALPHKKQGEIAGGVQGEGAFEDAGKKWWTSPQGRVVVISTFREFSKRGSMLFIASLDLGRSA